MLGAARRDDDDRRADPLGPRRLDQLPAVELGQHQVEDADVRVLVAQAGEPELAAADDDRVEAGGHEVAGHAVRDHVVVFDDQDLGHVPYDSACARPFSGFRNGDDLVTAILPPQEPNEPRANPSSWARSPARRRAGRRARCTTSSFDELRTGFTAAVSHELRTPLARILALLDSADLPGADVDDAARAGARRGRARRRADRRDPVPVRARERQGGRRARPHERAAGAREGRRATSRAPPRAPASRWSSRATATSTCRCARACCG